MMIRRIRNQFFKELQQFQRDRPNCLLNLDFGESSNCSK
jgi:hypothetical protein